MIGLGLHGRTYARHTIARHILWENYPRSSWVKLTKIDGSVEVIARELIKAEVSATMQEIIKNNH